MTVLSVVLVANDRLRGAFFEDLTGVSEAIDEGSILIVVIRALILYDCLGTLLLDFHVVDCCCYCLSADDKE